MFTFMPRPNVARDLTVKVYGYNGAELSEHEFNPTPLKLFVFDAMKRMTGAQCNNLKEIETEIMTWLDRNANLNGVDKERLAEDIMEEVENGGGYIHFDGRNYNVLETRIFKDGIEGTVNIDADLIIYAMLVDYK